jgi:ribonuclease HII
MNTKEMSISQIKSEITKVNIEDYPEYILLLKRDERAGVQQIAISLEKKYQSYIKESIRIDQMKQFEDKLYAQGYEYIAGIDEVGRGPLAGPVVSCAVVLPQDSHLLYINDSKKLSIAKREALHEQIKREAISIGVGIVDKDMIDEVNIYEATKQSMKDAIDNSQLTPQIVLIDAMHIDGLHIPQKSIIKGDEKCYSIAAASIVAKVTRDKMMDTYDEMYPEYHFKSNKGYGTQEHIDAIHKYGTCPIHRMSFLNN